MAKLENLLSVLRNSGEADLLKLAENLERNRKEQLKDHSKFVDESYLYTLTYDIDTDWDFYIGGESDPKGMIKASTREELIKKFKHYFLHEAKYCNSSRVEAFKEHYILEAVKKFESDEDEDLWTTGGNWEMSFSIHNPPNQNKNFDPKNPPLTIGGIDFE